MTPDQLNFEADLAAERATDEPALVVDVEGFEGPLDLLLALARQQKVDLAKISVLALAKMIGAFRVSMVDKAPVLPVGVVTTQPDRSPLFAIAPR